MLQSLSTTGAVPSAFRRHALSAAWLMAAAASLAACEPSTPAAVSAGTPQAAPVRDAETRADAAAIPEPASAPASGAGALIGKTLPPYPDDLAEIQGSCVPGGAGLDHACDFGLALLGDTQDGVASAMRYVVASRNADTAAEQPRWQVSDAIDAPKVGAGYSLQISGCRLDRAEAPGVVAVVRYAETEYSSDVTWARRFDTGTGKISEIPAGRVDCANPGFGI